MARAIAIDDPCLKVSSTFPNPENASVDVGVAEARGWSRLRPRNPWRLLDVALLVGVAFALVRVECGPLRGDETAYQALAERLLDGRGYVEADGTPTVYRNPGLPATLAATYALLGTTDHCVGRRSCALITSFTAPVLYGLLLALFGRRSLALAAGLAWAALGETRGMGGILFGEALAGLCLMLALWLAVRSVQRSKPPLAALGGLVLGFAVLTRVYLVFAALGPLVWMFKRAPRRLSLVFAVCFAGLPLLWAGRARVELGLWTLSTQGIDLWRGNNAWCRGDWPSVWRPQGEYLHRKYPSLDLDRLSEAERHRFFVHEAVEEITRNPGRVISLWPRKLSISLDPNSFFGVDWTYVLVLPLALLGIVRLLADRERRHLSWLLLFPLGGVAVSWIVVFGDPRFRHPVNALIVALAAAAVALPQPPPAELE